MVIRTITVCDRHVMNGWGDVPGTPQMLTVTGIRTTVATCPECRQWIDDQLRPVAELIAKYGVTVEAPAAKRGGADDGKKPCGINGCGTMLGPRGRGLHVLAHHPELAEPCPDCDELTTSPGSHKNFCRGRPGPEAPAEEVLPEPAAAPAAVVIPYVEPMPEQVPLAMDEPAAEPAPVTGELMCKVAGCAKPGPYDNARSLSQHVRNHPELKQECPEPGCSARIKFLRNHYRDKHPGKRPPRA